MNRIDDSALGSAAPKGPHLAVLTSPPGNFLAMPLGSTIMLSEEAGNVQKTWLLTLVAVSHRSLDFQCACRKEGCNRRVRFKASWQGNHPQEK